MAKNTRKPMYKAGTFGFQHSGDTGLHSGHFVRICVVEAAAFQTLTGTNISVVGDTGDSIGTITFPALDVIDGNITDYRLSSGVVRAYWGEQS